MTRSLALLSLPALLIALAFAPSASRGQEKAAGPQVRAAMNPDIGANALMLYTNSNRGNFITSPERNGPSLQEVEVSFSSDVDPYSKLRATFSAHQEEPAPGEREGAWAFEPEEVFAETVHIPALTLKLGKFKTALGKHNTLHTHAFPFIDAPLANAALLGDEGFNDVGLSAAYLAPLPWFSELTVQVLSGRPEADAGGIPYFNNGSANASVQVVHWKNLVDLSDSLTGELGLSTALGTNEAPDGNGVNQVGETNFYGADLTFKWRPVEGGKYHSFAWATEALQRRLYRPLSSNIGQGIASWIQYQMSERWWLQFRADYLEANDTDTTATPPFSDAVAPLQRRYTALIGYNPSEFSGLRLQYSRNYDAGMPDPDEKVYLQFSATIGVHPAHTY